VRATTIRAECSYDAGRGAVGFMYRPVARRAEREAQRFVVTIRIIRADPPDSIDRQFAIGVNGFDLICGPL
jgi:hypothetical protein